jgi:hypothetical protein
VTAPVVVAFDRDDEGGEVAVADDLPKLPFGFQHAGGGLVDSSVRLRFLGRLRHEDGSPIEIEGLWALRFGNGVTGDRTTLLFTAGIDDEAHGLFGAIQAAS